ncbi:MAG: sodium-dependent transporter [Clostridia bacterium]|nr:sodium-dependent transporter [Clostridia bacterium]
MDNNNQQREHLGSRLGFILLSAGCAIGIGNVWKFPYMAGQHGGGMFVLIYLVFLAIMGIPVMTMEFAMGRAAQKSPAKLYQELEPKGSKWHIHGVVAWIGNIILMMFYTTVAGWLFRYFVDTATGTLVSKTAEEVSAAFGNMLSDPLPQTLYMLIAVVIGVVVCSFSLQKGLEKITKYMMLAMLFIMIGLAVNGFFMEGAGEGLAFYLLPSWDRVEAAGGIGQVVVGAMNQAFFTLSLGIGAMAIFGSYLKKERALLGEAINVAVLDTFVAICSGLIIFPAVFTYGADGAENAYGPGLIFRILPNIFNSMPAPLGQIIGSLFFLFLSFAALSTIFAVFENIIACSRDLFGWSKRKACIICGIGLAILSLPCVLGFNLFSGFAPFGDGSTIMDLEDFLVSNILLPLGSVVFIAFCVSRYGWGWDSFVREANEGKGLKIARWMRPYMTYVLPAIVLVFMVIGLVTFNYG